MLMHVHQELSVFHNAVGVMRNVVLALKSDIEPEVKT